MGPGAVCRWANKSGIAFMIKEDYIVNHSAIIAQGFGYFPENFWLKWQGFTGGPSNMAIITISQGSYSKGKEVAEKLAKRLGYECISRGVLLEASKEFNIEEIQLVRAIHDAPSILDRIGYRKEKYIASIQAEILKHFRKDNVVYCGLAGHFFVKDVAHVLKVRIIADLDERIKREVQREGITRKEALRILQSDDEERRRWSTHLYGIDTHNPELYDLFIHIKKITTDDAVHIICETLALERFKTSPESQQHMEDLALAAEVRAALVDLEPDVDVIASKGSVQIHTAALLTRERNVVNDIEVIARSIDGVSEVAVGAKPKNPLD
jgi:cytidylate kinase